MNKEIFGLIATAIGIAGYVPYFLGMYRGKVKPHIFSWFIWGLIMETIFIVQWEHNSGPGAWVTGVSSVFCIIVCVLGWRDGVKHITRDDWIVLLVCQLAIPFWYVIHKPLFTMLMLTIIELIAFYPTFRKAWIKPYEESALSYSITGSKFAASLLAIESFTAINWLYPVVLIVVNVALVSVLFLRRSVLKEAS